MRALRWTVVTVMLLVVGAGSSQVAGAEEVTEPPPAPESVPEAVPPTASEAPAVAPPSPQADTSAQQSRFANCDEAFAAGRSNILRGDPDYAPKLDRNGDGVACEDENAAPVTSPQTTALPPTTAPATTAPATTAAPQVAGATQTQVFENCTQARAAGQTNIPSSSPAYRSELDRDKDGIACDDGDDAPTGAATGSSGTLANTGASNVPLTMLAGFLVGLGAIAIFARKRLSMQRFIVIHSKTGAIRFVPKARRIQ